MKQQIAKIMGYRITNDSFDMNLARVASFVAAVFVMALSLGKLTRLELTEEQLFFGLLLSVITPLLMIIVGLLLPISWSAPEHHLPDGVGRRD